MTGRPPSGRSDDRSRPSVRRVVDEVLAGSDQLVEVVGDGDVVPASVTMDSRAVGPGTLFACVPGRQVDGHTFAAGAVASGAVALLGERRLDLDVPQIVVRSTRRVLGAVAAAVYGQPSRDLTVIGVTGTNGKTTTVSLLAAVLEAAGRRATSVGTLTQARTTPEAPELQARLAELRDAGMDALAMEVSSHALDQHRVDGVEFAVGILTNVTQDHLDYHGTMERYFEAKAALFEPGRTATAVVNRDDPWGRRLIDRLGGEAAVTTYGLDDAADLVLDPAGASFRWRNRAVRIHLAGRFNVANALAAAAAADVLGLDPDAVADGLGRVRSVRGRFEAVDAGQDFSVVVDYAHTPDGLTQVLTAAREVTSGELIVVFGAGGDRDHDKRPQMGVAAGTLADFAVLTSDNPRSEDPHAIMAAVAAGIPEGAPVQQVEDRHEAIALALSIAGPGATVVIAGKGHEQGQEAGGQVRPFDDAAVAREILGRLLTSRRGEGRGR